MNQVFAQPVGCGPRQQRPSLVPVVSYGLAAIGGGVVLAAVASAAGDLIGHAGRPAVIAVAGILAAAGFIGECRGRVAPLPERRRQVPVRWLHWRRPALTAAAFGFELGMGIWTLIHHAAFYTLIACMVVAPAGWALAAGAAYGAAKGLVVLASWLTIGRERAHRFWRDFVLPRGRVLVLVTGSAALAGTLIH